MRNNEQKIIFESPLHFQTYCYKNQWIYGGTNVSTDWQTNRPTDRITDWQCDLFKNHFVGVAPKGRCPVGHRGEFLYVCLSVCPCVRSPPWSYQSSNSHWITWKINKMQISHWITWKINEKKKRKKKNVKYLLPFSAFLLHIYYVRS